MNKESVLQQLERQGIEKIGMLPRLNHLQIELINHCNFQCPLCKHTVSEAPIQRSLSCKELIQIISPVKAQVREITLHGNRGEPFLNPETTHIIAWLKKNTKAKVSLSTNGSLVTPAVAKELLDSKLDKIIFAIDGLDQESYEEYRVGGELDQVLSNLKNLSLLKKNESSPYPKIIFQFMPMSSNEHQLEHLKDFALSQGADRVRLRYPKNVSLSPSFRPRKAESYEDLIKKEEIQKPKQRCPFGLDSLYLNSFGDAYSCGYTEDSPEGYLGNGLIQSITEIWDHPTLWDIRASFTLLGPYKPMCLRHCSKRLKSSSHSL